MTRTTAATVAALAAALLVGCRGMTVGGRQRAHAWVMQPAPVRAPIGAQRPAELRAVRLLAYADADYQAHAPDWEQRILDQVRRANEVVEVEFGIRLDVAVRRWERPDRGGTLRAALGQLRSLDRDGAGWVVGFVGPVPEDAWSDNLGVAERFRPAFVLRAMESPGDLARLAMGYDTLTDEERARFAVERRLHHETVVFLHEWAHTLGAVHECDGKWIMADEYGVLASTFSPESDRLIRVGLRHHDAAGAVSAAWRDAWRAEAARMEPIAWECSKLEKALAEYDAAVGRLAARGERAPAGDAAAK